MENRKLSQLVEVDNRFQNSINLQLDLNKKDKVLSYIPTKSSIEILDKYIKNICKNTKEKATILIGPYGKGKSHLLLVLLALISMGYSYEEMQVIDKLSQRIKNVSEETYKNILDIRNNRKKFLPVIISSTQMDLNQAYLIALNEALKRANLSNIIPNTFYTEAEKVICNWKEKYQDAYEIFCQELKKEKMPIEELILELNRCDRNALELFIEIYPRVTAGSQFNPMINMEINVLYEQINNVICTDYGYSGMFIIFDEFSKFIEGNNKEKVAADMKVLQEICELASRTTENQIHTLLVTHKSIKQYDGELAKGIVNSFKGVEGRLKEILFVSSSQNNYELIQNAIQKKDEFKKEIPCSKLLEDLLDESYSLPAFNTLFRKEDFRKIVVEGCFPLSPLSAYLLLGISEKVAQNERTLFTFISKDEPYSMARFIKNHQKNESYFITADYIFDYFKGIFKTDVANTLIHAEWLKADYALKQVNSEDECKVIKSLAILNIMNKQEEIPPVKRYLGLASGLLNNDLELALLNLKEKGIIELRLRNEQYYFKNNVAIDLEREITRRLSTLTTKANTLNTLEHIAEFDYVMPKIHNQKYSIKRFFEYRFCKYEDFFQITSSKYLFDERMSDGKVLLLLYEDSIETKKVQEHLANLQDERIVAIVPYKKYSLANKIREYEVLQILKKDKKFINDNKVIEEEIYLKEEEILYEINHELEDMFNFTKKGTEVIWLRDDEECRRIKTEKEFNRFISRICDSAYDMTPIINNEMINKNHISTQIKSARKNLIDKILQKQEMSSLEKMTTPEASIYRAIFIYTGLGSNEYEMNQGLKKVINEIDIFVMSSEEEKNNFSPLYDRLTGKNYGMRLGVIPVLIAFCIRKIEVMPIIYLGDREVPVNGEVLTGINEKPSEYSLYVVKGTNERREYLTSLRTLFEKHYKARDEQESIIVQDVLCMQRWMRSLSSVASTFNYDKSSKELSKQEHDCLRMLRKYLKKIECNSRELLFDKIPAAFPDEDLRMCYQHIERIKRVSDNYIIRIKEHVIDETKKLFSINSSVDLANGLYEWYSEQSESAKNILKNSRINSFMSYLSKINTFDEKEIVNKISKICLGMYIEDWREDNASEFLEELKKLKQEIELTVDENLEDKDKIILTSSGQEIVRFFDGDVNDSVSYFLKNQINSVLDEFGDSLEVNQKVSVLVQLISELIK